MKIRTILQTLETLAPPHLAESWDTVGLQIGRPDKNCKRALLCIDLTDAVLDEAIASRAELVIAYHPPMFKPVARLTPGGKGGLALRAAEEGVTVYSPHTALDAAVGGVNDWLAQGVAGGGEAAVRPILPVSPDPGAGYKLVTFVPAEAADALRAALSEAGAGRIGGYDRCSFGVMGEGTFRGGAGTNPTVGRAGRFERAPELRMEMIVPQAALASAVAALRGSHPYEEPAFDLVPLRGPGDLASPVGQGRIVELARPVTLGTLVGRMKRHLSVRHIEASAGAGGRRLTRIGLCAGAGGSLLDDAGPLDAFITGEMRHHDVLAAEARGTAVLLAGHTQTERPYLKVLRRRLGTALRKAGGGLELRVSRADRAPTRIA